MGQHLHVLHEIPLRSEDWPDPVARIVEPKLHRHDSLHHRADTLAPPRSGCLHVPDGSEYPYHVGAGHLRHRHLADEREGVAFQAAQPDLRVLGVAPAGPQLFLDLHSDLREGRQRLGAALLGQRIAALAGELAIGEGFLARFLERNERKSTEPEFGSTTANGEALDPTPAAGGPDIEIKALSITIPSGLIDVADRGSVRAS